MPICATRTISACMAAAFLGGCGTTYSLKEFSPTKDGPKTAFVDIKQRAILSGARKGSAANSTEVVTCAEPSPDALSSLASEFAADAKYKDSIQATLGFSQQESASFVGLRTQTIQLLRDGMYRLCEGYLSGALTQADFAWLSRRYQKYMVALLTIEQLTRVAQVPTLAHASQGLASASRSASAIQSDLEELDKNLLRFNEAKKKLTDEQADIDKLPDTDSTKTAKIREILKRLEINQASMKSTEEVRIAMLEGLKTAKGVLVSGSTTVQIIGDTQDKRASAQSDAVTKAIAEIAEKVLDQDDLPTLCFQILDGSRPTAGVDGKLKDHCIKAIESRAAFDVEKTEILRKLDIQKLLDRRVGNKAISSNSPNPSGAPFDPDDWLRQLLKDLERTRAPVANMPKGDIPKLFEIVPKSFPG